MKISEIRQPQDIHGLSYKQLNDLAEEIRQFLIMNISKTGGHLSSNLGVVELTMALHYVFDSPRDKIFFDVGHQSYVHKILTGRADQFSTLRQMNGLSGFQKRKESEHDPWEAGHSSTALSAALGMSIARDLDHGFYHVVPVVGDAAMAGGLSVEALNEIGFEQRNMVIIFNDNNMSISKNVGALNDTFTRLRTSKPYNDLKHDLSGVLSTSKAGESVLNSLRSVKNKVKKNIVNGSFFSELNLDYIGPVDGHDFKNLIKTLKIAKEHKGPIVVHVITEKGKGYKFAENDETGKWHGVSQFNPATGEFLRQTPETHCSWSEIISKTVFDLAKDNEDIVTLTPAMIGGSKLEAVFKEYPNRSFDCGIAEDHAAVFAASLANSGKRPFLSIYSSFLQRAYDQMNHELARMDLPVVLGVDRCGLVGEDGATHHGIYDIQLLRALPNFIIAQPKDATEAQHLLYTAFKQSHPFALRYPRGSESYQKVETYQEIKIGSWTKWQYNDQSKCIIFAYGCDVDRIISKASINSLPITLINTRFMKPLDHEMLIACINQKLPMIIYENDVLAGGLSSAILEYCNDQNLSAHFKRIGIKDHFVDHGSLAALRKSEKIDLTSLFEEILKIVQGETCD